MYEVQVLFLGHVVLVVVQVRAGTVSVKQKPKIAMPMPAPQAEEWGTRLHRLGMNVPRLGSTSCTDWTA